MRRIRRGGDRRQVNTNTRSSIYEEPLLPRAARRWRLWWCRRRRYRGIAGLGLWAFVTYLIGTRLLPEPQTRADVGELMRTLGFAQSPGLVRILGVILVLGPLVLIVVSIWMLVAMVIAVRQALDYTNTLRAVGVCLVGWVLSLVITIVFALLFGSVGI